MRGIRECWLSRSSMLRQRCEQVGIKWSVGEDLSAPGIVPGPGQASAQRSSLRGFMSWLQPGDDGQLRSILVSPANGPTRDCGCDSLTPDGRREPVVEVRQLAIGDVENARPAKAQDLSVLTCDRPIADSGSLPIVDPAAEESLRGRGASEWSCWVVAVGPWVSVNRDNRIEITFFRRPHDDGPGLGVQAEAMSIARGHGLHLPRERHMVCALLSPRRMAINDGTRCHAMRGKYAYVSSSGGANPSRCRGRGGGEIN